MTWKEAFEGLLVYKMGNKGESTGQGFHRYVYLSASLLQISKNCCKKSNRLGLHLGVSGRWHHDKKKKKRQLLSRTLYSLDQTPASWEASGCHDNQSCSGWEAAGWTGCCNFQKGKKKRRVHLLVLNSVSSLSESWVEYADTLLDSSWGGVPLGVGKKSQKSKKFL